MPAQPIRIARSTESSFSKMNRQNLRARMPLLLLLLLLLLVPSIHSLLTPHKLFPKISLYRNEVDFPDSTSVYLPGFGLTNCRTPVTKFPTSLPVAYPGKGKSTVESWRKTFSKPLSSYARATSLILASIVQSTMQKIRKYWWLHPMLLALVPPYSLLFRGSYATMPDWWGVVDMGHIAASENGHLIIAPFLGSNAAYVLSGTYLMKRFGCLKFKGPGLRFTPSRLSMLGVWTCISGLMSIIYHSAQALGPYTLAENLCYLDHAIAGSATFYFADTCGVPSKTTAMIAAIAAVTLVASAPNYAWIHSSWHFLSALTATRWGLDGYKRILQKGVEDGQQLERA